jgi:protein gp37
VKNSPIEWTHHTFNPWWGCNPISPGCSNCYGRELARRYGFEVWGATAPRRFFGDDYWYEPLAWNRQAAAAGERRRVMCGSMCDIMEPREDLAIHRLRLWDLIERTDHLDWLLCTKRPENFPRMLPHSWMRAALGQVWLLATVENLDYMWRIEELKKTPAVIHGLSLEPLLGPLPTLGKHLAGIDWVIVGLESGPKARPGRLDNVRGVVSACREAGVRVFVKQLGTAWAKENATRVSRAGDPTKWPADLRVREFPKGVAA